MRPVLLGLIFLLGLASCHTASNKALTDITSKMEEDGFIDLTLDIVDKNETADTFVYTAEGLYNTDTVGLKVSLKKHVKAGVVDGEMKNVFLEDGITFQSIGNKSDKLLAAMAKLYGQSTANLQMKDEPLVFTCANLNQNDANYQSGEYRFKIFMESDDDYSELFVNFDFSNNLILLNEKDMEYRAGVIHYLATSN